MAGLIDLNTTEDDETPSSGSSASSSSVSILSASGSASTPAGASGFASSSVCLELWHACAGPLISLPRKGSVVVYLPQGHLEQVSDFPAAAYELPPHLFCRVVDVKLHVSSYNLPFFPCGVFRFLFNYMIFFSVLDIWVVFALPGNWDGKKKVFLLPFLLASFSSEFD